MLKYGVLDRILFWVLSGFFSGAQAARDEASVELWTSKLVELLDCYNLDSSLSLSLSARRVSAYTS